MSHDNYHRLHTRLWDQQSSLYELYARRYGLQSKSLIMLMWIYHSPEGISQRVLAEKTYSTKQVVNATVKNWLAKGYLTVIEGQGDRRIKRLSLTEAGRQYATGIIKPLEALEARAMASLSPDEQGQLYQLTAQYVGQLQVEMEGQVHD